MDGCGQQEQVEPNITYSAGLGFYLVALHSNMSTALKNNTQDLFHR